MYMYRGIVTCTCRLILLPNLSIRLFSSLSQLVDCADCAERRCSICLKRGLVAEIMVT